MKDPQKLIGLLQAAEGHIQSEIRTATGEWKGILPFLLGQIRKIRVQFSELVRDSEDR